MDTGAIMEQQMQQQMEAGEAECSDLINAFMPPIDWQAPDWFTEDKVHNWRNYISDELQAEWDSFTGRQKIILSSNFDDIAGREEWD